MPAWYHFDAQGKYCLGPPPGQASAPVAVGGSGTQRASAGAPPPLVAPCPPVPKARGVRKVAKNHCPAAANPARAFRDGLKDELRVPLGALKAAMRRTRGKGAQQERKHVRVVMAGMSSHAEQRALRERAQASVLSSHRVSTIGQYTLYCASKGRLPGLITCEQAQGFLAWSVVKDEPVASHTLGHVLSNLRTAAVAMGNWRVTPQGELALTALVKSLKETIPSNPRRTVAVPVDAVLAACERLRRDGSLQALQTRALLAGAMGALARGTEVGGDDGMRWGDLIIDYRGMAFKAFLCKTGRASLAARVRVCPHMPKGLEPVCPSRCVLDFKASWEAMGGAVADDDLAWCKVSKNGLPTTTALSTAMATKLVRAELVKEGVPATMVDAHWARHTGRHLLDFELGFGEDGADFMGDWAPPIKGSRKKSVGAVHYAHMSVDEIWSKAMTFAPAGFVTRCCRR
jgi:hypothetical protein